MKEAVNGKSRRTWIGRGEIIIHNLAKNEPVISLDSAIPCPSRTADNGKQSSIGDFLLVDVQILRNSKGGVCQHKKNPNQNRKQYIQRHIRQHQDDNRDQSKHSQHNSIINDTMKQLQRLISEKVKEEPGNEQDQEQDQGNRVPEEAKKENEQDEESVIGTKVFEIALTTN